MLEPFKDELNFSTELDASCWRGIFWPWSVPVQSFGASGVSNHISLVLRTHSPDHQLHCYLS